MSFHQPTREAASGKWKGILKQIGVPESALTGKPGPCPVCGGKDRFRFDNDCGSGSYFCNGCGAGYGMSLVEKFTKRDFKSAAQLVDRILGNHKLGQDPIPEEMSDERRRAALREVSAASRRAQTGDLVDAYLRSRCLDELIYPKSIRFAEKLRDGEGGIRPCMVAVVTGPDGKPASLHRTFLMPDGSGKAEMEAPRKMMPGPVPEGSAVQLSDYTGGPLGIAEGIETAMAASNLYEMPCWSAINSTMLAKWWPPEGCDEVVIFADNDPKYGGQAAAYRLAHRLACRSIGATVKIPDRVGTDFADVWLEHKRR